MVLLRKHCIEMKEALIIEYLKMGTLNTRMCLQFLNVS